MSVFENNPSNILETGNVFRDDFVEVLPNLAHPNVATGTDFLQNTKRFLNHSATATISSSTEWKNQGSRSLKVVTQGINTSEGMAIPNLPCVEGEMRTLRLWLYGTLTNGKCAMRFKREDNSIISNHFPTDFETININDQIVILNVPLTPAPPETVNMDFVVTTSWIDGYEMAATFYIDRVTVSDKELPPCMFMHGVGEGISGAYCNLSYNKSTATVYTNPEQIGNVNSGSFSLKYKGV